MKKDLSRRDFLQKTALAGVAVLMGSVAGFSKNELGGKKVRVAVIGCGSVSNRYLPHLQTSDLVEIVSCCDIRPERAKFQAEAFKIPNHYGHIDQLLTGAPFDLLVNLTDMQEHGRLNRIAIAAGKHVWSEKPMASSYREGRELLDLAISKKLRFWGAPAVVNSPQFKFMSEKIQAGKLGRVAAAHGHYGHTGPTWSSFFYEKDGGSLPDLGVYNIATLTGLLGPAKSVVAMTSIITPERQIDEKGTIRVNEEDNAVLILEHEKGVLSSIQCGFNYFDPFGHEGKGQNDHTIKIWGSHGSLGLVGYDWETYGVDFGDSFDAPPQRFVQDPGKYVWQMGATVVAESLVSGVEPLIQAEHALHVLEIIEATRKSGKTGKRVKLKSRFKWPVV